VHCSNKYVRIVEEEESVGSKYIEHILPHKHQPISMSPVAIPSKHEYSIACMPADGIGPEVIGAGVEVLKTLSEASGAFKLTFEDYDWSSETYKVSHP
jgi:hypothetical protein